MEKDISSKEIVTVVVDASTIIALCRINKLQLLKHLLGKIYIPNAVYYEVVIKGREKKGANIVKEAIGKWIERKEVENRVAVDLLSGNLGDGEAESIVLAKELGADLLVIDEEKAKKLAISKKLPVVGLVRILIWAKRKGLMKELKPSLDELVKAGFRLDDETYSYVLQMEGEL
ncbi:DUF3368 domain-containing protein [bacterium]|nr:DUF3368 domain-containing protein [bacterium]MBU2461464.1 DUF3368 domain-containing protein [bacterium]